MKNIVVKIANKCEMGILKKKFIMSIIFYLTAVIIVLFMGGDEAFHTVRYFTVVSLLVGVVVNMLISKIVMATIVTAFFTIAFHIMPMIVKFSNSDIDGTWFFIAIAFGSLNAILLSIPISLMINLSMLIIKLGTKLIINK